MGWWGCGCWWVWCRKKKPPVFAPQALEEACGTPMSEVGAEGIDAESGEYYIMSEGVVGGMR